MNFRLWVKRSWFYSQFQKNTGTNQILHSLLTECHFLQFGCQLADLYIYPLLGAKAAALTAGFRLRSAKLAPIFNVAVHSWSCLVQNSNHRSLKKKPIAHLVLFHHLDNGIYSTVIQNTPCAVKIKVVLNSIGRRIGFSIIYPNLNTFGDSGNVRS